MDRLTDPPRESLVSIHHPDGRLVGEITAEGEYVVVVDGTERRATSDEAVALLAWFREAVLPP